MSEYPTLFFSISFGQKPLRYAHVQIISRMTISIDWRLNNAL
jgi:hypothetical protein